MNCKKIKKLIETDYLDDELSENEKNEVEEHIKNCPSCSEYKSEVVKQAVDPFRGVPELKPPESVWQGIEAKINEEAASEPGLTGPGFLEKLHQLFPRVKPVWGVAVAAVFVLTVFFVVRAPFQTPDNEAEVYLVEQMNALEGLEFYTNGDEESLGTTIETYFM